MNEHLGVRRFARVPVERPVYVTTPLEGFKPTTILSFELGEGGCLLASEDFFGVGRIIIIDIFLESRRPVRAIGKVLYEYRDLNQRVFSGVEFQYLDHEHQEALKNYVAMRTLPERELASA